MYDTSAVLLGFLRQRKTILYLQVKNVTFYEAGIKGSLPEDLFIDIVVAFSMMIAR